MTFIVVISIRQRRRMAKACGTPNVMFVTHPRGTRPHECLVVKACWQQPRQPVIDGTNIKSKTRPTIHGPGNQALIQLHLGRSQVRRTQGALTYLHQRVGLLSACSNYAPGSMVFKASTETPNPLGQQRSREAIARMTRIILTVELEPDSP